MMEKPTRLSSTLLRRIALLGAVALALLPAFARPQSVSATLLFAADEFSVQSYANNNGSVNWAGNWTELGDDGTAGGGDIRITGGELRFDNRSNGGTDESIERSVDLSGVSGATLSFNARTNQTEAGDTFEVTVYDGDTSSWTVLQTFDGVIDNQVYAYDISPYLSSNTRVRFRITGLYGGTDEYAYIDNVQVNYFTTSTHVATDVRQTVQIYYIPVAEDQALLMMDTINAAADSPTAVYVSISVTADNTVIYFDHWEDDFEISVTDPAQSTTEVWGDDDLSNGAPPGYTTDILYGGNIIILNNWVPTDHLEAIDFDGGDKIASTEAIAVTRTSWASGSGTLHGGSVEMLDTSVWGMRFDLPVHDTTYYDFTYTGVALMASEDDTLIYRNGAYVATLDEGESYLFSDTVAVGDVFTASAPIQANLLNGNIGSNYASDWLTLYPFDLLSNSYYAPVGPEGAVDTAVYLHNPNEFQITVNWETTAGAQTSQVIDAHQGVRVTMPTAGSGAHFYTTGATPPVFQAISTINSGGQANDWGYTLIPENQLTQQAMVGWGVGRDPTSETNPSENGSPVWVVAVGSGTMNVCVDYDGDGMGEETDSNGYKYDELLSLTNLVRGRVYDTDGDQTGMLLYLCNGSETGNVNKIAVAWGQDPSTATPGAPGLDVGTAVPPLPNFTAIKGAELIIDLNSNTRFDVRDTFAYEIVIQNTGALPVPAGSILVTDIVPQYTTYVPNSTTFFNGATTTSIPDNTAPATVFPLDEGGYTVNETLPIEGEFMVSFQVQIDPSLPGLTTIQNNANVSGLDLSYEPAVEIVVQPPLVTNAIGNRVWIDENGDGLQNPGEPGLANVIVELYDADGVTLLDSVVTDANGNYLFPDLDSGTYQVQVNAGSLPSGLSVSALGAAGEDFNNQAQPYTVSVGGGENMTADFGYNWAPAANVNGNTGAGAIGDRVWVDADGDGMQDPGEPGLGGVTVSLLTDDNGDGVYGGAGDNPAVTTTTDAAGNYIFTGLAAGSYIVEVNSGSAPSGYAQTGDPDAACPGTGCDNRTTQPLVLAPGDVYLNADFGYQPTGASGTIGDTVWFNPDGDATLDAGEYGIPGVTVALIQDANGNGIWDAGEAIIAADITDAAGAYSFSGLPLDDGDGDADYLVWVNDTDNVLGELLPNYDADGLSNPASGLETEAVSAAALSAASPTNNDQDFGYGPAKIINETEVGVIGDTIFLDRNGNGAFDPGEGLENVEVELLNNSGTLIDFVRTDENGRYTFGGVPDGTYTVRIVQSTLPNGGAGLTNTVDPDTLSPGDSQSSVTLAAGNRINLDQDFGYVDSNPGAISGTLWTDTDADGALEGGETGRFAGVTVVLLAADGDVVAATTTDGNGDYSFSGLPAGAYYVHVTDADNLLDGYWQSPDVAPGTDGNSQSDIYEVVLAAGETNTTADFGYYRDPASVGDFVWEDLDQDGIQDTGEPGLAGINVTLTIAYPNGTVVTLVDVTDSNGTYLFDNLLLDEDFNGDGGGEPTYTITFATPTGYFASPTDQGGDNTADSDGTSVSIFPVEGEDDTTIDSGFYAVVEIGDRVWYDWDGDGVQDADEPGISGVEVFIDSNGNGSWDSGEPLDTTDANGNYTFSNLPGGDYTVAVRASSLPDGVTQTGDPDATLDGQHTLTTVAPGVYLDVDFGYQGAGSISDFVWNDIDGDGVQDAGEGGIGGVTVWVDLNGDGVQDPTEPSDVTDANGAYDIGGLPAGTYTVRASGAPISGATATYDLDGVGTTNVTSVVLGVGENRTDVDWGYQFDALSISKTSSAGGTVNPGDTIQYTIVVRNNTASQQTGIAITDPLPEGTTYVAQSTVATGYEIIGTQTYRDEFNAVSYANTDGTVDWSSSPWSENDRGGGGAGGGYILVSGNRIQMYYLQNGEYIQRVADLSGASSAILTYDWATNGLEEEISVQISQDGSTFTTLASYTGADNSGADSFDISSYLSSNTTLRFVNNQGVAWNYSNDIAYFDNIQILFPIITYRDEFNSQSYSNNDGNANWTGDWQEIGESNGATTDNVSVYDDGLDAREYVLRIYKPSSQNPPLLGAYRAVDLSTCTAASLSFTYRRQDTEESVPVTVDDNTSFTSPRTLYTIPASGYGNTDANYTTVSDLAFDATELGRTIYLRYAVDFGGTSIDAIHIDDITINCTYQVITAITLDNIPGGANPDLADGTPPSLVVAGDNYVLDPGQQMQVTFSVLVDDPVQQASIDNTASAVSVQQPTPQYASTIDKLPPSALGDYVWLDRDNDGIQDADEPGIRGVPVTLTFTYDDGTETFETVTGANGYYSFDDLYLNEDYTTAGATFSLSFGTPPGATPSPVEQGGDPAVDSNGATTPAELFYPGMTDLTYDSGFSTARLDLGDLPNDYYTLFSPGPAHVIFSDANTDNQPEASGGVEAVWLGTIVDVEPNGQPSSNAKGDDSSTGDEDGLAFPSGLTPGAPATFIVTINASGSGVPVHFGLWIDWNAGDTTYVFDTFASGAGTSGSPTNVPVVVTVPAGYTPNTPIFVRVRASTFALTASDATGTIVNGEIEDHWKEYKPTAVTLATVSAQGNWTPILAFAAGALGYGAAEVQRRRRRKAR